MGKVSRQAYLSRPLQRTPVGSSKPPHSRTHPCVLPACSFEPRHNSISPAEQQAMAQFCGFDSVDALVEATVPAAIKRTDGMPLGDKYHDGLTESEFLAMFK